MKTPVQAFRHILYGALPALLLTYIGYQWYRDCDETLQRQLQTQLTAALSELRTENRRIKTVIDKDTWEYRNPASEAAAQTARHIWCESGDLISLLDTLSQSATVARAQAADVALQRWYHSVRAIPGIPFFDMLTLAEISPLFRPGNWLSEAFQQCNDVHFQSICKQAQAEVEVICYRALLQIEQKQGSDGCGWDVFVPTLIYSPLYPAPDDTIEARVVLQTTNNPFGDEAFMVNGNPLTITEGVGALKLRYKTPGLYPLHVKHFYQTWENDSLYRSEQTYYLRVH